MMVNHQSLRALALGMMACVLSMSLGWLGPLAVGTIFQHSGSATTISTVGVWTLLLALAATAAPALRRVPYSS